MGNFTNERGGQGRRGLTLLETLLALLMLSLLIVGVLGVLGSLLVASTKSSDNTAGLVVAQGVLNDAESFGYPTPSAGRQHLGNGVWKGVKRLYSHEEHIPVEFKYEAVWSKLGEPAEYNLAGTRTKVQFGSTLYRVDVTVYWMVDSAEEHRAEGGGLRSVRLERIVACGSGSR